MTPPNQLTIQPATNPADLESIRILLRAYAAHLAATPANICIPNFERELTNLPGPYAEPTGTILLARVERQPAACVAFRPTLAEEQTCEMKRLWVYPRFRGHRLGRSLTEAGIAWARAAGYTAMVLDTVPAAMPYANALYQTLGFLPIARYNDNPVSDVIFLRLHLDAVSSPET